MPAGLSSSIGSGGGGSSESIIECLVVRLLLHIILIDDEIPSLIQIGSSDMVSSREEFGVFMLLLTSVILLIYTNSPESPCEPPKAFLRAAGDKVSLAVSVIRAHMKGGPQCAPAKSRTRKSSFI
uniref:Uncharacterized protein n=1 Tax=Pipistrellus kuhlii TaxID=59472 RepID=A0A7J7V6A4_PIPKU|nr:hypothetical protein mPipKuh1_008548 [Pipistrellus kuhlii]